MPEKDILDSWKEICAYLKRSEKTCRKWEHELGLPIHRIESSPKARVFAYKEELDRWMTETQHSEKKSFLGKEGLNRLFISLITISVLAIIVIIVWSPWSKEAPTPISSDKPSIAILPFVDLSPDKDQEYFCDGMTEELINRLSRIEGLRIPARTSSFSFKGQGVDIREIGEKLGVKNVLEGSIRKAGKNLRITVQLVNVVDGYPLWSEKFDRDEEDIFALQDEISLAITDKLKLKLLSGEGEKLKKRYSDNLETYNLYLKGLYFWNKRTDDGIRKSIEYFQQVINKDPTYALAYAGLAFSYGGLSFWHSFPPKDFYPKAKALAKKAIEIDESSAEAHTILGLLILHYDWDLSAAEKEFQLALNINPNHANSHHQYSMYLMATRQFVEAIAEAKIALDLDPLSLPINMNLGVVLHCARKYDKAIEQLKKTLEMDQNFIVTNAFLADSFYMNGMRNEALELVKKFASLARDRPYLLGYFGYEFASLGQKEEALKLLTRMNELSKAKYVFPTSKAQIYIGLDNIDQAFKYLEMAYLERDPHLIFINTWPIYDKLRADPRFKELVRRMNLQE